MPGKMATARCWETSTDLAGSEMERKKYYLVIEDEGKPDLQIIVVRGPGAAISVEPYVTHEYDYDDFDEHADEDEDYYYGDFGAEEDDDEDEDEEETATIEEVDTSKGYIIL